MDIHFNAFISYRHHPDDIQVAKEVHQSLERYHLPRNLKKKLNITGPLRLFRDKEELPITSNLNDDIADALRNSDFLIVICSVHTKESVWVQREIELFLQSHDRSQVLTVLASGEPYDVIPEILLYNDRVDPTTGEIHRELVEPLSCDWRIGKRKAKQEELPRLAAPLLGCAYDELRQRQKQYRTRRLVAAFSVVMAASLGFSGYVLRNSMIIRQKNVEILAQNDRIQAQNVEIQANLDESLRNQSRHLATAAQELLTEGDRLTAITLAAAALPGEDNQRPYVPEAELVLGKALGVYQMSTEWVAVGAVRPGSNTVIEKFWVSEADETLYVYDATDTLTTWDTKTLEKRATLDLGGKILSDLIVLPNGNAVAILGNSNPAIRCFQPDGKLLWQLEETHSVALLGEDTLMVIYYVEGTYDKEMRFLDVNTGLPNGEVLDLEACSGGMSSMYLDQLTWSKEEPVLVRYTNGFETMYQLHDLAENSCVRLPIPEEYIKKVKITDGKVFVLGWYDEDLFMGRFDDSRMNKPVNNRIYCFDTVSGELLWESVITAHAFTDYYTLEKVPGKDWILCQSGATIQMMDIHTGETIGQCKAGNSILSMTFGEEFAVCLLEDGYRCNYTYEKNHCYETRDMENDLVQAVYADGIYTLQYNGTKVTVYRKQCARPDFELSVEGYAYPANFLEHGDLIAVGNAEQIYMLDAKTNTVLWQQPAPGWDLLRFSQDGKTLWCGEYCDTLIAIDTASGKQTILDMKAEADALGARFNNDFFVEEDTLIHTMMNYDTSDKREYLRVKDLETNQQVQIPLNISTEDNRVLFYTTVKKLGQYVWVWTNNGILFEVDLATETYRILGEGIIPRPAVAVSDDGRLAMTLADGIYWITPGGSCRKIVSVDEAKVGRLCFYGDELLVLCDDGYLRRYTLHGTLLSQTAIGINSLFAGQLTSPYEAPEEVNWQFTKDGQLILNAFTVGSVIDCESWELVALMSGFMRFDEAADVFLCYSGENMAGYPRYNTRELLAYAQETLQNFTLTPEQKAAYGIN